MGYRRNAAGQIILKCEPVIDADTFNRANDALENRPKRGPVIDENRALCSSILFCPVCGGESPMYRIRGGEYRSIFYYRCTGKGAHRKGCGNNLHLTTVDALVDEAMSSLNEPIRRQVLIPGTDHSAELADVQFRIKDLANQNLNDDAYDSALSALRAERDEIKARPTTPDEVKLMDTGETYASHWASLTTGVERNDWLRSSGIKIYASHDYPSTFAKSISGSKWVQGGETSKITVHEIMSSADGKTHIAINLGPVDHSNLS